MKLPGVATLTFDVEPLPQGRSKLTQTARFQPKGLFGIVYWYGILPLHAFVFARMLRGIRDAAEVAEPPGHARSVSDVDSPAASKPVS
jgi:hypothetical protein